MLEDFLDLKVVRKCTQQSLYYNLPKNTYRNKRTRKIKVKQKKSLLKSWINTGMPKPNL
jgi:hypothetical protein